MLQKLLIVGSAESTQNISQTIKANFFYGYNCIGYLSEEDRKLTGINYLGHPDELAKVLDQYKIEKEINTIMRGDQDTQLIKEKNYICKLTIEF